MIQTFKAIFDGTVFRPATPVKFPAQTEVKITAQSTKKKKTTPYSSLRFAAALKLKGPKDFSENLDEYLYHGKSIK